MGKVETARQKLQQIDQEIADLHAAIQAGQQERADYSRRHRPQAVLNTKRIGYLTEAKVSEANEQVAELEKMDTTIQRQRDRISQLRQVDRPARLDALQEAQDAEYLRRYKRGLNQVDKLTAEREKLKGKAEAARLALLKFESEADQTFAQAERTGQESANQAADRAGRELWNKQLAVRRAQAAVSACEADLAEAKRIEGIGRKLAAVERIDEIRAAAAGIVKGLKLDDTKGWRKLAALWTEGRELMVSLTGNPTKAGPFCDPDVLFVVVAQQKYREIGLSEGGDFAGVSWGRLPASIEGAAFDSTTTSAVDHVRAAAASPLELTGEQTNEHAA